MVGIDHLNNLHLYPRKVSDRLEWSEENMTPESIEALEARAKEARRLTVEMICCIGAGHIGGACSIIDALIVLYDHQMRIDPQNPDWPDRDRFILSKGHAGPALYAVLAMKGYFPREELKTLNQPGTNLPSHCDRNKTIGVDMTAGSLGQGLSAAVGMALAAKMDQKEHRIFALIGDGESQEGQIWEAGMLAAQHQLDNLIVFTDDNKMQIDDFTDNIVSLRPLDKKWESFGWNVQSIDGHDISAIDAAVEKAREQKGKPSMILLNTVKGKGLSFAEGKVACHSMTITGNELAKACAELQ